jgi:hypothetical protein
VAFVKLEHLGKLLAYFQTYFKGTALPSEGSAYKPEPVDAETSVPPSR